MAREDDVQKVIEKFNGLYARGLPDDVPLDHAQACLNLVFSSDGQYRTRFGLTPTLALTHAGGKSRRFFLSPFGLLVLDDAGNLFVDGGAVPLFTLQYMSDFAAITMFNRTYISPNDGSGGFYTSKLQVWDGTNIRPAAGFAPQGSVGMTAVDGAAGKVVKGTHKIMVAYITNSGFVTRPGPKELDHNIEDITTGATTTIQMTAHGIVGTVKRSFSGGINKWAPLNGFWMATAVDANHVTIPLDSRGFGPMIGRPTMDGLDYPTVIVTAGDKKIDLSDIPVGGSSVIKRWILATKADEEEFFFVPDGIIANNADTTATIDFDDEELIVSADYLFDLMEEIPSGTAVTKYRGRLVIAGSFPNVSKILLSRVGEPESFSKVTGYTQVPSESDGNEVQTAFALRDVLYLCKPVGIFGTEDNNGEPSTWAVTLVDGAIGCYNHGLSSFTSSQPARDTGDIVLIGSKAGLYLFDGVVRRPELSWKIQDLWQRLTLDDLKRVTVSHDIWNRRIYIALPLDGNGEPNCLIVGDYSAGWDNVSLRWNEWKFPVNPTAIGMFYYNGVYKFQVGTIDAAAGSIWGITDGATDDYGTPIDNFYYTASIPTNPGTVAFYTLIRIRARGNGDALLYIAGEDEVENQNPPLIGLVALPGKDLQMPINLTSEKMAVKIRTNALGHWMSLDRIDIFANPVWQVRPA